jgi:ABC-type multidrug transport system ATPase subunit
VQQFDKVTLLYEGRQIYFGPVGSAATYFQELGFEKPERATIADFLTSLTNPAERVIRDGHEDRVPRSAEEFANTWNQSPEARKLIEEIDAFDVAHPLEKKGQTGLAQRSKLSDERSR